MFTSEYAVEFLKDINQRYYPKIDMFDKNQMNALRSKEKGNLLSDFFDMARLEVVKVYFSIF